MFATLVKVLRKYCVPETDDAVEPSVTAVQLPSEKFSVFQFESMLLAEVYIFHSTFFMIG